MENILHVGLDVGSTTVKIVVMDNNKNTIYKDYQRHFSDTKNTVCKVLEELVEKYTKQLELYKRALEEAMDRKVNKIYIYSTHLNEEILL